MHNLLQDLSETEKTAKSLVESLDKDLVNLKQDVKESKALLHVEF